MHGDAVHVLIGAKHLLAHMLSFTREGEVRELPLGVFVCRMVSCNRIRGLIMYFGVHCRANGQLF